MEVVRKKNGRVDVDEQFEPNTDQLREMQRIPDVVEELTDLVFRETPTVAVSALVAVLGRVLLAGSRRPNQGSRNDRGGCGGDGAPEPICGS